MAFGFAPPMQPHQMMQPSPVAFPQMNLTSPGPAGFVPQMGGAQNGKGLNMADIRTGLQKLGIGGPPAAQTGGGGAMPSGPSGGSGYAPPAAVDQMNWGGVMGPAMSASAGADAAGAAGGAAAGTGAGAAAAGDAAGGAAAAGGGADIGGFLMALLGL